MSKPINNKETIKKAENNFTEFEGRYFAEANGLVEPRFETKVVAKKKGFDKPEDQMVVINFSAVDPATGERVYFTLWPHDDATKEDKENLPRFLHDITFRIGWYETKDENGQPVTITSDQPKWTVGKVVNTDGELEDYALNGGARNFDEENKKYGYKKEQQ